MDNPITEWIGALKAGDRRATQPLWEAYFKKVVELARSRLHSTPRPGPDEEDVALSAFDSFFRCVERGAFPRLEDRDDLWQILFVLTVRKAIDHSRHQNRQIRGGGKLRSIEDLAGLDATDLVDLAPSPDLAVQITDECRRLLQLLADDTLRTIALSKMEGYTNAEIARRLDCVEATIERKLQRIRRCWSFEFDS